MIKHPTRYRNQEHHARQREVDRAVRRVEATSGCHPQNGVNYVSNVLSPLPHPSVKTFL